MLRGSLFVAFAILVVIWAMPGYCGDLDQTHTRFTLILQQVEKDSKVDYYQLRKHPEELKKYLKDLANVRKKEYETFTVKQQISYWVNLYNAATIWTITQNYPILPKDPDPMYPKNSVRQIEGFWTKLRFNTALGKKTLNQIELEELTKFHEPLIVFILCNGTMGSPPLPNQAIHPERLEEQLADAAREFCLDPANVRADPASKAIYLSEVFKAKGNWFVRKYYKLGHFKRRTKTEIAILNFLNNYAGMMEKMMILKDDFEIKFIEYDWSLNER